MTVLIPAVVILSFTTVFAQTNTLNVSLYYESLCPDSKRFITEQLFPGFLQIGDYLNIDYVPFGFAEASQKSGVWSFTCQHGPDECYGNKVQSCAIDLSSGDSVTNFIDCAMENGASVDAVLEDCAVSSGIAWDSIVDCLDSGEADELLVENGKRTEAVTPEINYVPTVIFNGVYDDTLQDQGEHYFLRTACQLLSPKPEACEQN